MAQLFQITARMNLHITAVKSHLASLPSSAPKDLIDSIRMHYADYVEIIKMLLARRIDDAERLLAAETERLIREMEVLGGVEYVDPYYKVMIKNVGEITGMVKTEDGDGNVICYKGWE